MSELAADEEFRAVLDRLTTKARTDYYNPYTTFDWPDALPGDGFWMSPELMSVHGTSLADELPRDVLQELSRWESVNFYSLNVHGIRELLIEVTRRIHTPGFEVPSAFFHHFIGEENEHMWFFAEFCLRYAGRLYPDKRIRLPAAHDAPVESFLVFARILIFEQIVDHYNVRLAADDRLHPTIRHLNHVHHQDESRHIAFGCRIVEMLWQRARDEGLDDTGRRAVADYLAGYLTATVESFYSPVAYRDAGIPGGFSLRRRLLADPARQEAHAAMLHKTTGFLTRIGVLDAV